MNQAIVVCAIIHRKISDKVEILLTQRSLSSTFLPGAYEIPGGHIEYGEDIESGLKREIKEELNISIKIGEIFSAFTYDHNDVHTVEIVYLATTPNDTKDIVFQEDEIEAYRWITEEEVDSVVTINKNPNDPEINIIKNAFQSLYKDYRSVN